MADDRLKRLRRALLEQVPADGDSIGNAALLNALADALGERPDGTDYSAARDALFDEGLLVRGRGRGGSVRRAAPVPEPATPLALETQSIPESVKAPKPVQSGLPIAPRKPGEPVRPKRTASTDKVLAYRHAEKRVNNPEVGLVNPEDDADERETTWAYDPHIDPALQFDIGRHDIETLIDNALASGDDATMRRALEQLKRQAAPYLAWTGKAERTSFEVDTVSLHVHERIDPATILAVLKKRIKPGKVGEDAAQYQDDMFRAWFDRPLPLREAIEFYKHDRGWANRLIAGDSLLVMNSLIQKESMAGQVQMIYIDPPYGIKYGSNFQPFTNKRDVKDRRDEDLTQEPEMIKAFRDTWELGIHSYLTYLRDRLLLAKELLHESGSVFVQISDENLHHVRELMDEVFGAENFVAIISYSTTSGFPSSTLSRAGDYIVWYGKSASNMKYNQMFLPKELGDVGAAEYKWLRMPNGTSRPLTTEEASGGEAVPDGARLWRFGPLTSSGASEEGSKPATYFGKEFSPTGNNHWKVTANGLTRLANAGLLTARQNSLSYYLFADSYPVQPINNLWLDTKWGFDAGEKSYVVQTNQKIVERCLLMTTDPGDLVLDPTCGSGTTAFVAEKWGRRWITCDTSRVAVTLAKQRLMTASYDYYDLKYPHEGLKSGFIYKSVPHVTLKSIANNPDIDEIHAKLHPAIENALADLNTALLPSPIGRGVGGEGSAEPLRFKITEGGRKGQIVTFGTMQRSGKTRTLTPTPLPTGEGLQRSAVLDGGELYEWEVPFDFPDDWPEAAREAFDAFHAARQAMQSRMDASIAAHADSEILYDQPQVNRDKLRISGPFTVEAVPFATVLALDEAEQPKDADTAIARSGESARQHGWRDELLKTGIRGKNGQILKFAELETLPGTSYLHCSGALADGDRVVVSFGPEHAALEQRQVALALNEAEKLRPSPKFIIFAAFTFDPEAAKDIDETRWSGVTLLKAQMNTDLLTADLKKKQRGNQSFWLMGQPDVDVRQRKDGTYEVEVNGFDYFDTRSGELESGGKKKIAMWLLDTDYDERSLYPRQVFFPMAGAKDGWHKLKKNIRAELDETRLEQFHGTVSLPFEIGDNRRIAVKIVDDRGIESLKVIALS